MTSICVFMGAHIDNNPTFLKETLALGKLLEQRNIRLVYGGSTGRLMGKLADCVLQNRGTVTGVMARALCSREIPHQHLTKFHLVDTMGERKKLMADLADAFTTLPGGLGTLEEVFEVWNAEKIGASKKPVGFLNVEGYYDFLFKFLERSVDDEFIKPNALALANVATEPKVLLDQLIR